METVEGHNLGFEALARVGSSQRSGGTSSSIGPDNGRA